MISPAPSLSVPAAGLLVFFQLLPGLPAQIHRYLDLYRHVLIAMNARIGHGHNALSCQPDLRAGLGSFLNFADHISGNGGNRYLSAENRCCKRNGNGGIHIHSLPLKTRLLSYRHLQQQISRLRTARS